MKKVSLLWLPLLLLSACASNGAGGIQQSVVKPLLDQECRTQINNRNEWKIASVFLGSQKKQEIENKVCGCVSEEAANNMTTENTVGLLNPSTRAKTVTNMASQSIGACIKKFVTN